jgi:uncharacterized protein (DUF2141 family)
MIDPSEARVAITIKPSGGNPMRVLGVAWMAVLVVANLPAVAFAQSPCPGIHVEVSGIRNSTGNIACALFESPVGFPIEFLRSATHVIATKIRKTEAGCDFVDIPPGTYAIAVVHDENMNGKLDSNWLGIPTEGYGFSNAATGFGEPSFTDASFRYDGQRVDLTIGLHY